jgi:hypothetical protein
VQASEVVGHIEDDVPERRGKTLGRSYDVLPQWVR